MRALILQEETVFPFVRRGLCGDRLEALARDMIREWSAKVRRATQSVVPEPN